MPPKAPCLFNFLRLAPAAFSLSTLLVVASLLLMIFRGFDWGLDFTGGLALELQLSEARSTESLQQSLKQAGFSQVQIQQLGNSREVQIRLAPSASLSHEALSQQLITLIHQQFDPQVEMQRVEWVGPNVGHELAQAGFLALLASLLGILLYVALRFEWRLACSAVLALAHDVIIALGALSLLKIAFDLTLIAALLSVVGYSLNDTIVVFDRIRENFRRTPEGETGYIINLSLTQTLSRTLITSSTTLVVVLALLLWGGPLLRGFSIVLFIGIIVGTFSSIYVASALALKLGLRPQQLLPTVKESDD
jgi:preprotein translocase subunit SecF